MDCFDTSNYLLKYLDDFMNLNVTIQNYEKLIELYMQAYIPKEEIYSEIPEYLLDSVNNLLESTLTLDL